VKPSDRRFPRAEHRRSTGRGETIYDPWHYVPVLVGKPGPLRNGAPFKDWVLPRAMERGRRKLARADGNRETVAILATVVTDGLRGRWTPPAPQRSPTASIRPTSFSTSWRAAVTPARRSLSSHPTR
jgi:hypothetical protein